MARLPEKRRHLLFRALSRAAGLLALTLILFGFGLDAADVGGPLDPVTILLLGIYVLGVQIFFMVEYFIETGGIE